MDTNEAKYLKIVDRFGDYQGAVAVEDYKYGVDLILQWIDPMFGECFVDVEPMRADDCAFCLAADDAAELHDWLMSQIEAA